MKIDMMYVKNAKHQTINLQVWLGTPPPIEENPPPDVRSEAPPVFGFGQV